MKAPNFNLKDSLGNSHQLTNYLGKWVIIYFYPKDNTPGCTKEACNFRDNLEEFQKINTVILGISKDSVKSHQKFSHNFKLNFPILSDENAETIKAYNSWGKKKFMGKEYEGILRNSFLINPEGEIEKIFESVNPLTHPQNLLEYLKNKK